MRNVTYSTIRDLVEERSQAMGHVDPGELRPITVRLEPHRIAELDLLARHLGYSSRQQFTMTLLNTAIDDALQALSEALEGAPEVHEEFTASRLAILSDEY